MSRVRDFLNDLKRRFNERMARNVPGPAISGRDVSIAFDAGGLQRNIRRSAEQLAQMLQIAGSTAQTPDDAEKHLWAHARGTAHHILSSLFDPDTAERAIREGDRYLDFLSQESPTDSLLRGHRTPYEFWTLYMKQFRIEQAVESLSYPLAFRPIVEMLPTGQVNAMAIPIPLQDQYIVVFESGLKPFSNLLCKAVVSAWLNLAESLQQLGSVPPVDKVEAILDSHRESTSRFQKVLLAYLFMGDPVSIDYVTLRDDSLELDMFTLPAKAGDMSVQIEESMDLFVIGHEYGHVIARDKGTVRDAGILFRGKRVKETLRNWEQEFRADDLGLQLLLEATKKTNSDCVLSYCGADLFFSLIDVVQRGVSLVKTGKDTIPDSKTHPPTTERRDNLRRLFQSYVGADRSAVPTHIASMLQLIVARFFDRIAPTLKAFHNEGKQLAPIWYQH